MRLTHSCQNAIVVEMQRHYLFHPSDRGDSLKNPVELDGRPMFDDFTTRSREQDEAPPLINQATKPTPVPLPYYSL